jgi:type IV secretory pathway VirB2 component (pilin)
MKAKRVLQLTAALVPMMASIAHAAGTDSPMAGVFTTVEGWLTGDIAEWLGICAIVGLGALIWFAHDYGHIFGYMFKGILGVAVVVFAIVEYTTAFAGGATLGASSLGSIGAVLPLTLAICAYCLMAIAISKYRAPARRD